jgi:uncharacterized protein YdeI (YjbR/CyaY-like superfamily)
MPQKPARTLTFFPTPAAFRAWLAKHHSTANELHLGYYKKHTGKPSVTWPESVDQALCYGWIDGIRRKVDESVYTIRFTPRKAASVWSAVNIRRAKALIDEGQMRPAGLAAFERRTEYKSGIYSYEQRSVDLPEPYAGLLKKNKRAWARFHAQLPSYRKQIFWWVVSAKKEETRLKRLNAIIAKWSKPVTTPTRPTAASEQRRARSRPVAFAVPEKH